MSSKHSDREEDGVVFLHVRRADSIDERLEDTKEQLEALARSIVRNLQNDEDLRKVLSITGGRAGETLAFEDLTSRQLNLLDSLLASSAVKEPGEGLYGSLSNISDDGYVRDDDDERYPVPLSYSLSTCADEDSSDDEAWSPPTECPPPPPPPPPPPSSNEQAPPTVLGPQEALAYILKVKEICQEDTSKYKRFLVSFVIPS